MKEFMEVFENLRTYVLHPLDFYTFLESSLRAFMLEGAVSIETAFQYRPLDKSAKYWFRTTIQLDGDIITIVPGSDPYDSGWQEAFQRAYRAHQEKLRQFVSQLDGIRFIAWMTGTMLSAIPTVFIWKLGPPEIKGHVVGWAYLSLWPILAYIARRYVVRAILWVTIRMGAWLIKPRWRFS
jgi:hypothetical protein